MEPAECVQHYVTVYKIGTDQYKSLESVMFNTEELKIGFSSFLLNSLFSCHGGCVV